MCRVHQDFSDLFYDQSSPSTLDFLKIKESQQSLELQSELSSTGLRSKNSRKSDRKTGSKSLVRTGSCVSHKSDTAVSPIISNIDLNSRRKWVDIESYKNSINYITIYEEIDQNMLQIKKSSQHKSHLTYYMIFDPQSYVEISDSVKFYFNLSTINKNDSEIESEMAIHEISLLSDQDAEILSVTACSGVCTSEIHLSTHSKHLLKITLHGVDFGWNLNIAAALNQEHHSLVKFDGDENFDKIFSQFVNTYPYAYQNQADKEYAEFVEKQELDARLVDNISSEMEFETWKEDFENSHKEKTSLEFFRKTSDDEKRNEFLTGKELFSNEISGNFKPEAGAYWHLIYRDIFYAKIDCQAVIKFSVTESKNFAENSSLVLKVVDNDNGESRYEVHSQLPKQTYTQAAEFDIVSKVQKFAKNNLGYTFLAYVTNDKKLAEASLSWSLETIANTDFMLLNSRENLMEESSKINSLSKDLNSIVSISNPVVPDEGNLISKISITSKTPNLAAICSIRANVSNPDTWIRVLLIEQEETKESKTRKVISETRGQGSVVIPAAWFHLHCKLNIDSRRSTTTLSAKTVASDTNNRKLTSAEKQKRQPSPKGAGKPGKKGSKSKLKDKENTASSTSINSASLMKSALKFTQTPVIKSVENLVSRSYFLELVYESWEFTENQKSYIEDLRSQAIADSKVFGKKGQVLRTNSGKMKKTAKGASNDIHISKKSNKTPDLKGDVAPAYSVTFVFDKELAEDLSIEIDTC